MLFLRAIVWCAASAVVAGYGDGYYSKEEYGSHCKKLKPYEIRPASNSQLIRKAKFTHLERNRKQYTMINCPSDSFSYALVVKNSGSVFKISGSKYPNTAVLAAGFNVGVVAKCNGKRTSVQATDEKNISIKKVACIQYTGSQPAPTTNAPTSTAPVTESTTTLTVCTTCIMNLINPFPGVTLDSKDVTTPGSCQQTEVICGRNDGKICDTVDIYTTTEDEGHNVKIASGYNRNQLSTTMTCNGDGEYTYGGGPLERNGKYYTMIKCPNDSFSYALVAENYGSVSNVFGSEYSDTAVLAAGFNVGVEAKCDGKRTTVQTTDGKKINIKKVACIQLTSSSDPVVTQAPDETTTSVAVAGNRVEAVFGW